MSEHSDAGGVADPAPTAEALAARAARLERDLRAGERNALRLTRAMHRDLARQLETAQRRARTAESRAAKAEARIEKVRARARAAEQELAAIKQSATWRAGRAVTAVPARLRRRSRP